MAKYLRYMGEFLSRAGMVWRVEILQEADHAFEKVGVLVFEAEETLVIEWNRAEKEDVVCGSTATLKLESPGDRTYEDLYTIAPGRIRMDVYRSNVLYWSGALDPEFYEEPYERAANYPVSLTFSDFGVLDRLKYDMSGMRTIKEVVQYALEKTCINFGGIDFDTYASTYFEGGKDKATIAALSVRSENFFDEDGEASTLKEVLEGMLQPLALRMVQRAGRVYVYDINGLYHAAIPRQIEWDGSSSVMGTDKVYNNAKINFSPYTTADLINGEVVYDDVYGTDLTKLTSDGTNYFSYYPDYSDDHRQGTDWDYRLINFTIFLSDKGSGLAYLNPSARYFHILPMLNGPSECNGVAWSFYTGGHGSLASGFPKRKLNAVGKGSDTVVMRTNRAFIPKLSDEAQKEYYLRVTLEMLLDPRYNPFTESNSGNESGNYDNFKGLTGWAFVPIGITLYDIDGNAICHYDNSAKTMKSTQGNFFWSMMGAEWKPGAAQYGDCWLSYYDPDDLGGSAGILGWKANRQNIGRPDHSTRLGYAPGYANGYFPSTQSKLYMYDSFKQQPDGEYIPYPTNGGYIEIVVYAGVRCFDYGEILNFNNTVLWDKKGLYDKIRWLLYKAPKVELVKNNLVFDAAELDDVEYNGYLNVEAKEELSIDTVCGTANKICPTAKGIYCRSSDSLQVQKLTRAGVTDHPENLLIGTLYSQYADRKTTLEGECRIDPGGVTTYTEVNQGDKIFMMSGEVQDVITDCTEAKFTEIKPDEYEAEK